MVITEQRLMDVPSSAQAVVIGSGDRCFAPAAQRLRSDGVAVIVLAEPRKLSGALRGLADEVVPLRLPVPVSSGLLTTTCDCASAQVAA